MPKEVSDIEFMAQPDRWPNNPILPLVNRKNRGQEGPTSGILVYGAVGRFVWYEGANMWATAAENEKYLANSKVLLAPQLQSLIDEGWEVD